MGGGDERKKGEKRLSRAEESSEGDAVIAYHGIA
jgi:hypothetical protein